jgi:hypothetical protein
VRCAFTDSGQTLLCEISDRAQPGTPATSLAIEPALKKAGYQRDTASGRFLFPFEIGEKPGRSVWGATAAVILNPLIGVFGARPASKIEIVTPPL